MAKSADAADLKSAGRKRLWEFKSPSGHHGTPWDNAAHGLSRPSLLSEHAVERYSIPLAPSPVDAFVAALESFGAV
jgi:hypothetical protein